MKLTSILSSLTAAALLVSAAVAATPQVLQAAPTQVTVSNQVQPNGTPLTPTVPFTPGTSQLGVFDLTIAGSCPGPITISVTGATPGAQVALAWSLNAGSSSVPGGACGGTALGLAAPNLLTILVADASGQAAFAANAPSSACGVFLQAVDLGACAASDVEQLGGSASSFVFPSATSTVIGSLGFVDSENVGYFWDVNRGDSVSETFSGPGSVSSYTLDVDVPQNFLSTENIDWEVVINGTVVDTFQVVSGQTSVNVSGSFASISGPSYDVSVRVTNTISPGFGSCTFRYAGAGQNALTLQ
ncbi:MAG: hypothetical protein ACYTF3_03470 [Planctomycetota bacterium]|jgi:hypothetical protein